MRLGFGAQGWDLDLEVKIWVSKWEGGMKEKEEEKFAIKNNNFGWDLDLQAGKLALVWDLGLEAVI